MRRVRSYYLSHQLYDLHILLAFAAFVLWLISKFTRVQGYSTAGYVLLCVTVISFIIHRNLRSLHLYMKGSEGISYLPAGRIRRMNGIFLAFYVLLTAAFMIILPKSFMSGIFHRIAGGIHDLISMILQRIFGANTGSGGGVIAPHDINYSPAAGQGSDDGFLRAVIEVVQTLMMAVAALFALYLLYLIITALCRRLMSKGDGFQIDEYQFIETDGIREAISRRISGPGSNAREGSEISRIRRQYRRNIRRHMNRSHARRIWIPGRRRDLSDVLSAMTPHEIESFAGVPSDEENRRLHEQYEKVRYGKSRP